MSKIRIFHHDDLDGYAAAAAVYYERYDGIFDPILMDFIELNHTDEDKNKLATVEEDDVVWIVDYSFSENTLPYLREILRKTNKVNWIDHHKTSVDLIKAHPELVQVDGIIWEGISGAALTYMYINNMRPEEFDEIPGFLKLVSDYDCWQHRYRQSDFFMLGMKVTDMRNIFSQTYYNLFKDKGSTTVK